MSDDLDQEYSELVRKMDSDRVTQNKQHARDSVWAYREQRGVLTLVAAPIAEPVKVDQVTVARARSEAYPDSCSRNAMIARRLAGQPLTWKQRLKWWAESFSGRRYL